MHVGAHAAHRLLCMRCALALALACVQVYYYPGFHAARDASKLSAELRRNLTRPTAWEAVMRIRCSRGLKISSFHGHFFNRRCGLQGAERTPCMCQAPPRRIARVPTHTAPLPACVAARSTDLLALPTCDPDKAFAVQIGHEETMVNGPVAFVQCALLHTSSNGERRIRCARWWQRCGATAGAS